MMCKHYRFLTDENDIVEVSVEDLDDATKQLVEKEVGKAAALPENYKQTLDSSVSQQEGGRSCCYLPLSSPRVISSAVSSSILVRNRLGCEFKMNLVLSSSQRPVCCNFA